MSDSSERFRMHTAQRRVCRLLESAEGWTCRALHTALRRRGEGVAWVLLGCVAIASGGCTIYSVRVSSDEDGKSVEVWEMGAPLISRVGSWEYRDEWLEEETNDLHEVGLSRTLDENSQGQEEVLKAMIEAIKVGASIGATGAK